MNNFNENCIVCGKPLIYHETAKNFVCHICGCQHQANAACGDEHYVCDECHADKGIFFISRYVSGTDVDNPLSIAAAIMGSPDIKMHGPEHHYLVVAALLAAYKNSGGSVDFVRALHNAEQRARKVPGGICGLWGSCGAGIATGIFVSVVTGATPLAIQEWSLANTMTSHCLAVIAANGGPRCCKRNTYLAIMQAVAFAKEQFQVTMALPESIHCTFSDRNAQCRKDMCLFYPA